MRVALELGAAAPAAAAALGVAAALAWHAARATGGRGLLLLRALAALALVGALLEPTVALREPLRRKPRLAVLIDTAHSMRSSGGRGTRLEAALRWLVKSRSRIEGSAEVSLYSVAGRGRRLAGWDEAAGLKVSDAGFEPAEALSDVAEDAGSGRPQRVWLLSDGNAERSEGLERALAALKAPVDAIGVGPARGGPELGWVEVKTPDFAFLHGRFSVEASLEASGMAGQGLELRLLRQERDAVGNWSLVDRRSVWVSSPYETVTATFSAVAQSLGPERYRLEARPAAGRGPRGLSRDVQVEVIRQKYRIMYLSGRPSPEYAFLREFLKGDPNRELVSFVILRNPENPALVPDNELSLIPFPAQEIFVQNLSQFDLFILENFSYARFRLPQAYLESLRGFVAGGGALLVIGGESAFGQGGYRGTALEQILPVSLAETEPDFVDGEFHAQPTAPAHPLVRLYDTPEESRRAWEALPALDGYARFQSVRPGSTVLAVHPTQRTATGQPLPVLALREYGRGKVMLVSTDSTWRWRLGAASDWRVGSFYARFWSRAVEYLTGSLDLSKVKFSPIPERLPPREPATFSVRVFDEGFRPVPAGTAEVSVLWTAPGGRARELVAQEGEAGVFSVELTGLAPGLHRLRAIARLRGRPWGEDQARFQWEEAGPEVPMDRQWLKRVADASGGLMRELSSADAGELAKALPPAREEAAVDRRFYPWASPLWLWVTAALLLAEWGLRRLSGLP